MKRILSITFVLMLLLSLCACGSSKYIGTYQREFNYLSGPLGVGVMAKEVMHIEKSGKGTFQVVSTKDDELFPIGTVLVEGTVSWEETDGNITITKSEISYTREDDRFEYDVIFYTDGNKGNFPIEIYALSGNKLVNVDNNRIFWNMVK